MPAQASPGGNRTASSLDPNNATSNAINTFLGARQRQPSWMSGGGQKSNPRPPLSRQPPPQAVSKQPNQNQTPTPTQPVLLSPAPSDEPSPAVSNGLDSPNPTPASLTDRQTMAYPGASGSTGAPVTDARFVPDTSVEQYTPNGHDLFRGGYNGHLQSPSIASPPFMGHGQPGTALAPPQVSSIPPPSPILQTGSNNPVLAAPQPGPMQSPRFEPITQMGQNGVRQPKRRRTEMFKYSDLVGHISGYVQSCGGENSLSTDVERPRMQLLRDACLKEDGFFIALHQMFVLWSNSPQQVFGIFHIPPSVVNRAFEIIETVLKKNQVISARHREWFARFPIDFTHLQSFPQYASAVVQVSHFLEQLAEHYHTVSKKTVTRRYPYLVDELLYYISCYSTVLQTIFFTASRRRVGVPDGPLGNEMEAVFREDQKAHVDSSTGSLVLKPVTAAGEIERRNSHIIRAFKSIIARASAQLQQAIASATGASTHPAPSAQPRLLAAGSVPGPPAQPVAPSPTGVSPYNFAPAFQSNHPNQPQSPLNSPMVVSSPMAQNGFAASVPQQFVLQSNNHVQAQPTPYMTQGVQQHPGFAEEQMARYQQQLNPQMGYQQQPLRQPTAFDQHTHQQNPHSLASYQQMYTQLSNQTNMRMGSNTPRGQANFIATAPVQQNQVPLQAPQRSVSLSSLSMPQSGSASPAVVTRSLISPGARPTARPSSRTMRLDASGRQTSRVSTPPPTQLFRPYPIPTSEMPRDPSEHKAILMSLHQAHVRSPKRVVGMGQDKPGPYYQAAKTLVVPPTPIVPKGCIQQFSFEVTREQYELTCRSFTRQGGLLPEVEQKDGSLRWRVRCVKAKPPGKTPTEEKFCATDMSWPPNIFMKFNGKPLDIRRRSHNGKDLATELTDMVEVGWNVLQVVLPVSPDTKREKLDPHFLGVEMLETLSEENVLKMIHETLLPDAADGPDPNPSRTRTLGVIKNRINRPVNDDDIQFCDPTLGIDLADPFSTVLWNIPARGSECTHLECFDLDNFLKTRLPPKPTKGCNHQAVKCSCPPVYEPSYTDKWRCPICGEDARPYTLHIDGFLKDVRSELEKEGKLNAKSIKVSADGNWTVDEVSAEDDESTEDESEAPPAKRRAVQAPPKEIEVIEID